MLRLFTALEISPAAAQSLSLLQGGLQGARWIDPENFHVTLRFIGEVDEWTAGEIDMALAGIGIAPLSVTLSGLGTFGDRRRPRHLWAGVAPNPPLKALQAKIEQKLQRIGLEPEHRKYTPHVTIARLRDAHRDDVARYLEAHGHFAAQPFTVSRFVLFSSRPSRGGGPYIAERVYRAGEPAAIPA